MLEPMEDKLPIAGPYLRREGLALQTISTSAADYSCATTPASLHVLSLTPFYPVSGDDAQGCFVAEPLPWLEHSGIQSTVVAVQPFYRKRAENCDCAVPALWRRYLSLPGGFGLPASGRFLFIRIMSELRKLHRIRPIDVIHAHAALPCGHAALLLSRELRIPFVVTVHGLDAFLTSQVKGLTGRYCRKTCQLVYRSARKVICISDKVRSEVMRGVIADTSVIYNGVDTAVFAPRDNGPIPPVVLSVGNLIPIKGHALLLRAFANVQRQNPEALCQIIGDGPEKARLVRLAVELGIEKRVQFLGRRSRRDVVEAVGRCTLFALPSRYEGLGCVYLEAMSAGKPVIACSGQGIEEIIRHQNNGWLVAPEDLPAMSDAISRLLSDGGLRKQLGDAARQSVEQYSFARQTAELARLYRECLA